jgi:tetratricopeptide (TPR) repeat protein
LYEVSNEAERLAKDGRDEAYWKLLERTAERVESPQLRRSTFDSLGFGYAEAGRTQEAEAAYRKAIATPGPRDSNYYHSLEALTQILVGSGTPEGRAEAESLCLHALSTVENPVRELSAVSDLCRRSTCSLIHSAGARTAKAALSANDLSPAQRIDVTREAAFLFVLARWPEEATAAVRAVLDSAKRGDPAWTEVRAKAFRSARSVASAMAAQGFKDESYDLTVWAGQACPDLADTPAYLSESASGASSAGLRLDAIGYRTRLIERFPDDERTPEQLSLLAQDYFGLGDRARSAEFYRKVIAHPNSRPSQKGRAKEALAAVERTR